jgi:2-succinyl-5-enolpyruvyl-6-hydroxy-3-cyclohexene-1-carboxylate synthase
MNPSTALARVIVAALVDLGVRQLVLCPGSRSAPLAYALAEAAAATSPERRIGLHVRIDERSAGFLALGLAKGALDGSGAAVITTSGTAVANLHPAVLEASHAGVPLLVISADRPHELRGTGANQTTDQIKFFGTAVRWFGEIPAPQRRTGQVVAWRNVVARAVAAARGAPGGHPGPVQLNVAFADPLTPDALPSGGEDAVADSWPEPLTGSVGLTTVSGSAGLTTLAGSAGLTAVPRSAPLTARSASAAAAAAAAESADAVTLLRGPRTVVLAGDGAGPAAASAAWSAGWPLLAEPSSGARTASSIGPYRLLLDQPGLGRRIERVIVFGRPTLSRPVTRLLARDDVELVVVSRRPDWTDAARRASVVVPAVRIQPGSSGHLAAPGSVGAEDEAAEWLAAWQNAGAAAASAIDRVLEEEAAAGRLSGPMVAREVAATTRAGDALFVGSSNPIRDLDLTAPAFPASSMVLANRGLAGIDGTLSTASGLALALAFDSEVGGELDGDLGGQAGGGAGGQAGRVRCLVGDLTFLHDVGGLLVGRLEERPNLQVVVVDDDGGGIFGLLEHGDLGRLGPERQARFERIFGTPQNADLAALCAGYDVGHHLVDDVEHLRKALADPPPGTSVIQVRVDRAGQRVLADRLSAAALAAVADHPLR